jgi:hypothetical protein
MAEFANVHFEHFQKCLADHHIQHQNQLNKATMEEILYEDDKLMHARQDRNNCGKLVFDLHPAKLLLREDVISGEHERMTPGDFQATKPEYMLFKPFKFKEHISIKRSGVRSTFSTSNLSGIKKGRCVECLLMTLVMLIVMPIDDRPW